MSICGRFSIVATLFTMSALLAGCSASEEPTRYQPDEIYKLTILHTNDNNGRFWKNEAGEWGMAARKTIIDSIREEVEQDGGNMLLLSGGGVNKGVPESDLQAAIPDFLGMNMIGYDAMAVGSHEFDNPANILGLQKDIITFPMLAANIYDSETGRPSFDAFKIFEFDGLSVGVLGLTTPDTIRTGNPQNTRGLDFNSPVSSANFFVPVIQEEADIVIALAHLGHYAKGNTGLNAPGDITLATQVDGIDLIIGGHSQEALAEPVKKNNTLIVQAGSQGQYVGRADFEFCNGNLTLVNYKLIPVNHRNNEVKWPEDPDMLNLLSPYKLDGELRMRQTIGEIDGHFEYEPEIIRQRQTNLGKLIATAQLAHARADFAVIDSSSIRGSLEPGKVNYLDILRILPSRELVGFVEMTGAEVERYLQKILDFPEKVSGHPQFSGMSVELSDNSTTIKIRDRRLRKKGSYRMAISTTLAAGTNGYPKIIDHPNFVNLHRTNADALWSFIENNSPIKAIDFSPDHLAKK